MRYYDGHGLSGFIDFDLFALLKASDSGIDFIMLDKHIMGLHYYYYYITYLLSLLLLLLILVKAQDTPTGIS